ncbi:elongation factor P [Aurantiacibacter flavus]|uniref:Elongation factor P n=1 Tax=Aurantiacibacter flavus TaxID=3145232 RepID=A0ABV0CWJ8_9SPHN
MHRTLTTLALASAILAAPAMAQNEIGTIERGTYICELPGDVRGAAGIAQPEANFSIISASRYSSPQGEGTYLRRGDEVRMTSGPRNGDAYRMMSRNFLRLLDADGTPGKLRCIRRGR